MKKLLSKISIDSKKKIFYMTNEKIGYEDTLLINNFDDKEDFLNRIKNIASELYDTMIGEDNYGNS